MTVDDVQLLESRVALAVRELRDENKALRDRVDSLCTAMHEADALITVGSPLAARRLLRDAWIENEGT